jgi:hypothetical protein
MSITCPSCQQSVPASSTTCPNCGWAFNSQGSLARPSFVQPLPPRKIPVQVDLGVTVDRTGSSAQFRTGIPVTLETVLKQVEGKAKSVQCWLQSHGDLDLNEQIVLHTDGGTVDQAIADIKQVTYGGGGDPPEHHLDAIEHLLSTVPWTADPRRTRSVVVAFMTADTKPARSGMTASQLGEMIKQRGVLLILVCEPTPTLYELKNAAGGIMFAISNAPDPNDLQRIAAQIAASITGGFGQGGTTPMTR